MIASDLDLLQQYAQHHAEDAFAELVRRHLDLVHSAALRQVRSPQLAEEVAQSVFTDLARNAARLKPDTIVAAWLYQVTRRTAIDVVRREARRQLREQIATEMNTMNATTADWTHIEPLLDEAMSALDDTDRAAVLLRYFENKSLREVGATLGTSDDAAQKRVSRVVERLREFFAKRGVTVGASGLVVVISANAVQAAPVGLATTIATAAALAGTAITTTMHWINAKAIAAIVASALVAGTATRLAQRRETNRLHKENQSLIAQQASLQSERDAALSAATATNDELERLRNERSELPRLRGEVAMLRKQSSELDSLRKENAQLRELAQLKAASNQETNKRPTVSKIVLSRIGPKRASEEQIRTNIHVKVGDIFDPAAVDLDVRNLYGSGIFYDLRTTDQRTEEGVVLNYILQEKPKLTEIRFADNIKYAEAGLVKELISKVGEPLDEKNIFADAEKIEGLLKKSGSTQIKIKYRLDVREDIGEGRVTFELAE